MRYLTISMDDGLADTFDRAITADRLQGSAAEYRVGVLSFESNLAGALSGDILTHTL